VALAAAAAAVVCMRVEQHKVRDPIATVGVASWISRRRRWQGRIGDSGGDPRGHCKRVPSWHKNPCVSFSLSCPVRGLGATFQPATAVAALMGVYMRFTPLLPLILR